ncbi:MAG: arylesterase [Blastocatellales bacterium]
MIKKKKNKFSFALLMGSLLLAAFSAACQKSSAPAEPASRMAGSATSLAPAKVAAKPEALPVIVAFGDSLTAAFGILDENQRFTTLLQRKLDEKGYRYRVVNAGISGDTSAGGVSRLDWSLNEGDVKILILELGGNDGLRGLPVANMKKNLAEIIERAQSRGVTVLLAGMEAPPNLGEEYTREFRQAYRDLAKKYKLAFIPFVLDGVGGRVEYNQPDGIHPNAAGEKIMTENVWRELEPLLAK